MVESGDFLVEFCSFGPNLVMFFTEFVDFWWNKLFYNFQTHTYTDFFFTHRFRIMTSYDSKNKIVNDMEKL